MTGRCFPHDAFARNPDGSVSTIRPVAIDGPAGGTIRLGAGVTFGAGTLFMGMNLAELYDGARDDRHKRRANG